MGGIFSRLRRQVPKRFGASSDWPVDIKALFQYLDHQNTVVSKFVELCRRRENGPTSSLEYRRNDQVDPEFSLTMAAGIMKVTSLQRQYWMLLSLGNNAGDAWALGMEDYAAEGLSQITEFKLQLAVPSITNLQERPREMQRHPANGTMEKKQNVEGFEEQLRSPEEGMPPSLRSRSQNLLHVDQSIPKLQMQISHLQWQNLSAIKGHEKQMKDAEAACEAQLTAAQCAAQRHYKARISQLEGQCQSFEADVRSLQGQIGQLEAQASRQGTASGSYLASACTPNDMQLLADRIKQELANFTRALTTGNGNLLRDAHSTDGLQSAALGLARKLDVKFHYQSVVASILFCGFEAEDYNIAECLPLELDQEAKRADNYQGYKELRSVADEDLLAPLVDTLATARHNVRAGRVSGTSDSSGCVCHRERFLIFCGKKMEDLTSNSELEGFWSWPGTDDGVKEDTNLIRHLLPLLASVWISHLLAYSFEQPGRLLKIRRDIAFDAAYMDKVVVSDEEVDATPLKVAFVVVPGYIIGKSVVRAQVYLRHQHSGLPETLD